MNRSISSNIRPDQAVNIFEGFQFAEALGYPITSHATILLMLLPGYPRTGTLMEQCQFAMKITSRIKKRFDNWIDYYDVPNHHVWVLENPPHAVSNLNKLVHLHLGFHVPDHLRGRFEAVITDAVFEGVSKRARKKITNTVKITYHKHTWTLAAYLLKATDPTTELPGEPGVLLLDVLRDRAPTVVQDPTQRYQGRVAGKRSGLSRRLDRASRAKKAQPPMQLAA